MCNNKTGIEAKPRNGFPGKKVMNWRNEVVVTRGGIGKEGRGERQGKKGKGETTETKKGGMMALGYGEK